MRGAAMDYATLPAGRELDALIAEKVMGWQWQISQAGCDRLAPPTGMKTGAWRNPDGTVAFTPGLRQYSTDIGAAWQVVEAIERRGFHAVVRTPFMPGDEHHAGFTPHGATGWNGRPDYPGSGETAALAICRAALAAVGVPSQSPAVAGPRAPADR